MLIEAICKYKIKTSNNIRRNNIRDEKKSREFSHITYKDVIHCTQASLGEDVLTINESNSTDTGIIISDNKINITKWLDKVCPEGKDQRKKYNEFTEILRKFNCIKQHLPEDLLNAIKCNCKNVPALVKNFSFCMKSRVEIKVPQGYGRCFCFWGCKTTTVVFKNGQISNEKLIKAVFETLSLRIHDENVPLLKKE